MGAGKQENGLVSGHSREFHARKMAAAGQESLTRYSDLAGTTKVATTSFTYDAKQRLTNLHHFDGSNNNIANYTYTYDAHSRLTVETRNGTAVTYTYDDTDQVTSDGTATFTYDAEGNRTNTGYTTGTGNQLTSDGTWTYTYDDEGNQTKKSKGANDETWTYGYDHRNQLTWVEKRATDGGTLQKKAQFKYDAFGNRLEKTVDTDGDGDVDTTQRYALDGWNTAKPNPIGTENWDVVFDLDGNNNLVTRYLRGDIVDQIFARTAANGDAYWYLGDHLGSIRDITDNTGVVKDTISYDAFGNIISETDLNYRGRYAWTGREYDTEIDLQYNRARYYDAGTGRWLSQDPLGFDAGDTNLYRYVTNRPTTETDPSGLQDPNAQLIPGKGTVEHLKWRLELEKDRLDRARKAGVLFPGVESFFLPPDGDTQGGFTIIVQGGGGFGLTAGARNNARFARWENVMRAKWDRKNPLPPKTSTLVLQPLPGHSTSQGRYTPLMLPSWENALRGLRSPGGRPYPVFCSPSRTQTAGPRSVDALARPPLLPNRGTPPSPANVGPIARTMETRFFQNAEGLYVDSNGHLLNAPYKVVVMPNGSIRYAPSWAGGHQDISGGGPVRVAGTIRFLNGELVGQPDLTSGHYITPVRQGYDRELDQGLRRHGYDGPPVLDGYDEH